MKKVSLLSPETSATPSTDYLLPLVQCCFIVYSTLQIKAACSSDLLITSNQNTWCHNTEHNMQCIRMLQFLMIVSMFQALEPARGLMLSRMWLRRWRAVFWSLTPLSLGNRNEYFGRICWFHSQGRRLPIILSTVETASSLLHYNAFYSRNNYLRWSLCLFSLYQDT